MHKNFSIKEMVEWEEKLRAKRIARALRHLAKRRAMASPPPMCNSWFIEMCELKRSGYLPY